VQCFEHMVFGAFVSVRCGLVVVVYRMGIVMFTTDDCLRYFLVFCCSSRGEIMEFILRLFDVRHWGECEI